MLFCRGSAYALLWSGVLAISIFGSQADKLPNATHSGYLDVNKKEQAALFYTYYERVNQTLGNNAPVILWLQVCRYQSSNLARIV